MDRTTKEDISKYAFRSVKPPGLSIPEEWLYYALRDNYKSYQSGSISEQDAQDIKRDLIKRYDQDSAERDVQRDIVDRHAVMWNRLERAVTDYRKNKNVENADRIISVLYRVSEKTPTEQKEGD